jgi:hypothetical protein
MCFGMVSKRLSFLVTLFQGAFSDCYAMRLVDVDSGSRCGLSLNTKAAIFCSTRMIQRCSITVYWKHNWPECPLEVIKLSRIVELQQLAISRWQLAKPELTTVLH